MNWVIEYLPEAVEDLEKLDNSVRKQVLKGITKVQTNPLPKNEGGYGTPLGSQNGNNLINLLKIKFLKLGIRVVYKLEKRDNVMKVIVISARSNNEVYDEAGKRRKRNDL